MTSDYDWIAERRKSEVKSTVENVSLRRRCANCFLGIGLLSTAGGTITHNDKEFCSPECLAEYQDNQDECA